MEGNLYVEIKKCWMCKKYKSLTSFYKCKKYGRQKKCIECEKKYKQDHIEHIKKIQKNLTIKNKEKNMAKKLGKLLLKAPMSEKTPSNTNTAILNSLASKVVY